MWIFTRYGFYSVVEKAKREGSGSEVHVRSRVREQLEDLCGLCSSLAAEGMDPQAIEEGTATDYQYRVRLTRAAWDQVAAKLAQDLDYSNFKGEVHRRGGAKNSAAYDVYHDQLYMVYQDMIPREIG